MRNYERIDQYLNQLISEVYPQPQDDGHTAWALESIDYFYARMNYVRTVLDVGCGEAFCQPFFEERGTAYLGVCLGEDYQRALDRGRHVLSEDFNFLPFSSNTYDLVYSRHSLEHSFSPLLSLMEWKRITKRYIALVLPSGDFWEYRGQNHYYVLDNPQWMNLFEKTGLEVKSFFSKRQNMTDKPEPEEIELWYLLEKI